MNGLASLRTTKRLLLLSWRNGGGSEKKKIHNNAEYIESEIDAVECDVNGCLNGITTVEHKHEFN